jgi:hypothetical protein
MNEITMEAMRERIIGAVSPYVEIESPDLVEVRVCVCVCGEKGSDWEGVEGRRGAERGVTGSDREGERA